MRELTHADPGYRLLPEGVAVEAREVLQSSDGVNRVETRVDVNGVDGNLALPFVHLFVVEGVGRELEGVFGAGEVTIVIDGTDWNV